MSMVVMRRKARAKQLLSEKNTASGAFALSYTNTGKHLMGRTASRAKILPPLLRAFKNRRVDCCGGPSETVIKNVCVGSSKGIKKVPIRQISNRNRLKRLALKCSDGKCRDLNTNPLWQLSPEQHASARTERLAAMVLNSENGCIFNYKVTVGTKTASHPYYNTGSGNAYFLDTVESPVLKLVKEKTYRFKQNDATNAAGGGHPIQFWSTADKTGTQYTSISSGSIGTAGAYVDFTVPANAPNKIYYQCGNHGYMGNYFDILESDENLIKNRKCNDVERSQNSLLRGRVGCGVMSMTKEIKNSRVAMDASDRIRQIKSITLNASCITSIKPFNNKKCTPPA